MKRTLSLAMLSFFLASCVPVSSPTPRPTVPNPTAPSPPPTFTPSPSRFGVFVSRQDVAARPEVVNAAKELGAGWVRINLDLGANTQDYTQYLASGINVVLMVSNQDPSNIVTAYGTPQEWPNAGFPFKSQAQYQQQVRSLLQPALTYLKQGRQVWVQGGNEIFDASVDPKTKSLYWRGTQAQYLDQLQALYEAVKSVNANIPVVLTSFASWTTDALNDQNNPNHALAVKYVTELLTQGKFDAIDLHFYGCVEDLPAKVKAVKERMPAGKTVVWISTENGGPDFRCKTTPLSWKQDLAQFEQLQATQVPARLAACAENGASICLWFSLFDLKQADDVFSHLGLLDQDTNPPRKKSAYEAFKTFMAKQGK